MTVVVKNKVRKLKIWQLLERPSWGKLDVANVLELAREGHFGLYFMPRNDEWVSVSKSGWNITSELKTLLNKSSGEEEKVYIKLKDDFIEFCKRKKALLKKCPGLCRLATDLEVKISPPCITGSIQLLEENSRIIGTDFENRFGFAFINGRCKSPRHYFPNKQIKKNDLYVLSDQIEAYEMATQLGECEGEKQKHVRKQKRANAKACECFKRTN